ncbi:MAG: hypothetical protein RL662_1177 [Bacteroidota bacterium]|jgi:hypothetical protein
MQMDYFNNNKYISTLEYNKGVYIVLSILVAITAYLFVKFGLLAGMAFALLPIALVSFYQLLVEPYRPLMLMFISSYFIMGMSRYVPIPSIGMMADALLFLTLLALILYSINRRKSWHNGANEFFFVSLIWFTYCILELLNPHSSKGAWTTYVRFMAMYGFLISFLVPIIFNRYKDLKRIVFFWSIFSLMAFFKAWYQKEVGFDAAEMKWLYVEGKASTHILSSGVRYFSFFTDAANFGSGMGMSMVAFIIMGIHSKQMKWKIYYILVGLLTGYGMMLSGTRSAMIIPFAGFAFYILFSGKVKVVLAGGILILLAFAFLNFTMIGQGNAQIRRMRSAFHAKNDASYNLRKENQAKIGQYMADKPFGVGVGLAGGKASKNAPKAFTTTIASDSWAVVLWVETGIVGLILYIILFLYLQLRGAYIVFFKIKDNQLRYMLGALLASIFGIMVSSYSNEVVAQFPNGIIIFFAQAFIFMGLKLDKEISDTNAQTNELLLAHVDSRK